MNKKHTSINVNNLQREIKFMALDNVLYEKTHEILKSGVQEILKNPNLDTNLRNHLESKIAESEVFFSGGHESLRGKRDVSGNLIKVGIK